MSLNQMYSEFLLSVLVILSFDLIHLVAFIHQ
jgi:hypothetical protein